MAMNCCGGCSHWSAPLGNFSQVSSLFNFEGSPNHNHNPTIVSGLFLLFISLKFLPSLLPPQPARPIFISLSMCYNSVPPKSDYSFHGATLLSAYLWTRLTTARVVVSIAFMVENTRMENLEQFAQNLIKVGAMVRLVPVQEGAVCDCVSQALWLRNLAYITEEIGEDDLMMISESDVFIASDKILDPLNSNHRAWLYWVEPALWGGQTFAMSFTTMAKRDWRMILKNSSSCEEVLEVFKHDVSAKTLDDWGVDNGKHWESDQNVVTAQLLR